MPSKGLGYDEVVLSFYGKKVAWNLVRLDIEVLVYLYPKTTTKPTHAVGFSFCLSRGYDKLPVFDIQRKKLANAYFIILFNSMIFL